MVDSGQATATQTTYDGTPALSSVSTRQGTSLANGGTAYVARSDYRPLEIDSTKGRIVFSTYEYLPATPANNALLAVTTAHPGATVVRPDRQRLIRPPPHAGRRVREVGVDWGAAGTAAAPAPATRCSPSPA